MKSVSVFSTGLVSPALFGVGLHHFPQCFQTIAQLSHWALPLLAEDVDQHSGVVDLLEFLVLVSLPAWIPLGVLRKKSKNNADED